MNPVHVHLLLNHFPIIGTLIGVVLLALGIFRKESVLRFVGASIIVVMAIITLPVNKSGEAAEETVEHIQGVNEDMLEEHEEAAEFAMFFMLLTGIVTLVTQVLDKRNHPKTNLAYIISLVLATFTLTTMVRTGFLGGQIRHTEINGQVNSSNSGGEHNENEEHEKDEHH